jgi:glycosyltransferase involved in cell wall biosynthesis
MSKQKTCETPKGRWMKILVISSYPPRHCGIGAYAHAHVERLRAEGHEITVISPPDGDGDVRARFEAGAPFSAARRMGRDFDRILVHFQPSLYFRPRAPVAKILTSMSLLSLVRGRPQTEILVHEADPPIRWRPDYVLLRRTFRRAGLLFHTEAERAAFERQYRIRAKATIVSHTEGVQATSISREEARRRLRIDPDESLFVCAGFLHPDKGFERAVEAWNMAGMPGRMAIIGSTRDPTPENLTYRDMLRRICFGVDRLELREDYVSDEDFDAWIAAADLVIFPYRRSWSSGALARAQRLGTPTAVAAVGGLPEQAGSNDVVFSSDGELVAVIAGRVAARR